MDRARRIRRTRGRVRSRFTRTLLHGRRPVVRAVHGPYDLAPQPGQEDQSRKGGEPPAHGAIAGGQAERHSTRRVEVDGGPG